MKATLGPIQFFRFLSMCGLMMLLASCVSASLISCEGIPRDAKNTIRDVKAQKRALKVGVAWSPPWTDHAGDHQPIGIEVEIVEAFAQQLESQLEWKLVAVEEGFHQLKHHQLDILIGGFSQDIPFKDVGWTRRYFKNHVMAVSPGESRLLTELERFLKSKSLAYIQNARP